MGGSLRSGQRARGHLGAQPRLCQERRRDHEETLRRYRQRGGAPLHGQGGRATRSLQRKIRRGERKGHSRCDAAADRRPRSNRASTALNLKIGAPEKKEFSLRSK